MTKTDSMDDDEIPKCPECDSNLYVAGSPTLKEFRCHRCDRDFSARVRLPDGRTLEVVGDG